MQLKIYNNENTYVVNGPVYVNETTKIWCGKISDGEFKGAFVKILNYGELDDKAAKNELKNVLREEVNTLKQVSKCSKRVPSVKDYWDDTRESRYVVIMDTMPGVSLRAWLDKHQRDELQAKDIFIRKCLVIQICEIMRDISNKYPVLVHRDLKPENIFVNFNKETKKETTLVSSDRLKNANPLYWDSRKKTVISYRFSPFSFEDGAYLLLARLSDPITREELFFALRIRRIFSLLDKLCMRCCWDEYQQ